MISLSFLNFFHCLTWNLAPKAMKHWPGVDVLAALTHCLANLFIYFILFILKKFISVQDIHTIIHQSIVLHRINYIVCVKN